MPENFTVKAVKYAGEKDNPHGGKLYKFYCAFGTAQGVITDVYWQRKSDQLEVGQEVYGRIENGEFGRRFYTEQRPDGSGNQGSSGGTFTASRYERVPDKQDYWDAKDKRIEWAWACNLAAQELKNNGRLDHAEVVERAREIRAHARKELADPDVGGGNGTDAPLAPAADVSADRSTTASITTENRVLPVPPAQKADVVSADYNAPAPHAEPQSEEASPAQKGKLTNLFGKAGLSRDAMKAVVLFRCRSEKATKDGASKLIQDLMDGATHDTLLAEIHDAKRAGDPVAIRAAKLIPSEVPLAEDPNVKAKDYEDESGVPF